MCAVVFKRKPYVIHVIRKNVNGDGGENQGKWGKRTSRMEVEWGKIWGTWY